jgi:hypothetical protein
MTLILTQISKYGIIHASDSNLTEVWGGRPVPAGEGKKTFELSSLNAGLTVAGAFTVGGEDMDRWMPKYIWRQSQKPGLTLGEFADNLASELKSTMHPKEKKKSSLIHIAGYVEGDGEYYPEFYFVRNVTSMDAKGGYIIDETGTFTVTEDFRRRDLLEEPLASEFPLGGYQVYVNGAPAGRASYWLIHQYLDPILRAFWEDPMWKFRRPKSLREAEGFAKLYLAFIAALYNSSDYEAPAIGGDIQSYIIPAPATVKP